MKNVLMSILFLGFGSIYGADSFTDFKIQTGANWSKQENSYVLNHIKGRFTELSLEAPVEPNRFYCFSFSDRSIRNPQMDKGLRFKLGEKWIYCNYGIGSTTGEYRKYFYSGTAKSVFIGFFYNEKCDDGAMEFSNFKLTPLAADYPQNNLFTSGQFEQDGNTPMEWEQTNPNVELSIVKDAGFICGEKSMRIVQKTEKPHFDVRSTVFSINGAEKYEISFWGKTDKPRQITVTADIMPPEGKPNQRMAIKKMFELDTQWKQYQYVIDYHWQTQKDQNPEDTTIRISLTNPENQPATVFIDDVSIKKIK